MRRSCGYGVRGRVGKSSGDCGLMVSPADVPASYDFNSLICPSRTKAAFEHKRQFPKLSSPRRFAFELPRDMRPKPIFAFLSVQRILAAVAVIFTTIRSRGGKDEYTPPP